MGDGQPGRGECIFIVATVAEQLSVQYPRHIEMLADLGVRVEVFAGDFPDRLADMDGVTCHPIPVKRLLDPVGAVIAAARIHRHARRVCPQFILYGSPSAAVVGALGGRFSVRDRVFVVHGLREETLTGARRVVMTGARRLSERLSTQVIYVSESLRQRAERIDGRPNRRGRVAPGGFVGAELPPAASTRHLSPGVATVGFVGRLARDKGVPELVRAVASVRAHHPSVRLLLVGGPDLTDPLDPETTRLVESDPHIEVVDHVSDVRPYLRRMDLFCLPSHREGLPTVVLEAMSEMVPVVGSDATGVAELVTPETGWPCRTGSVESLAEAILSALDDSSEAADRARRARAVLDQRYAVTPVMAWWKGVYQDLFKDASPRTTTRPERHDRRPASS